MAEPIALRAEAVGAPPTEKLRPERTHGRRDISVVLPAYNEADNLTPVVNELLAVLQTVGGTLEIIVVDDGSSDRSPEIIAALAAEHPEVVGLQLRRNVGKSAALAAGFMRCHGDLVVLMDADGQDQPAEIPRMLDALDHGLDLVTGMRSTRRDRFVKRTTSRLYNRVTARMTGVEGRDFNSGFKVMRRQVADSLELYGELHRYIPVLAHWQGYRVGEIDVEHRTRLHGQSKFGRSRFWRGFLDLITVRFLTSYANRPLHLFGSVGCIFSLTGVALLSWLFLEQQVWGHSIGERPALIAGVLLVILGVQFLSLGLVAQLLVHLSVKRDPRSWVAREWSRPR